MANKEQQYIQQLKELGIYSPAFDAEIHQLCILERELSRARKQWKATAEPGQSPLLTNPAYNVITQIQRDILSHRDALGLTPKALRRLKGPTSDPPPVTTGTPLDLIIKKHGQG